MGDLGCSFAPNRLNEFGRIICDDAISPSTLKKHFERLQIMICCLRGDLSDQRFSERYNVLLRNLGYRVTGAVAEKLQKLRKTAAIKFHRGFSGLRLLAIQPIGQIFAQARSARPFRQKIPREVDPKPLVLALRSALFWKPFRILRRVFAPSSGLFP